MGKSEMNNIRRRIVGGVLGLLALAGLARGGELPRAVDLRPDYERHGITVRQQAPDNCWAFSVAGVLDYEYAMHAGPAVRLAAGFLTWTGRATDFPGERGSNFGRACRGLERYGICRQELCPAPGGPAGGARPAEAALADGAPRRNIRARWIKFIETPRGLNEDQVRAIKEDLAAGHPVAAGMLWPRRDSFDPGRPDLMIDPGVDAVHDGHCVALIGYRDDPAVAGGGMFEFRNSWGAQWKDHGYAWMTYQYARAYIGDAVGFRVDAPAPEAGTPGAGKLMLEAEALAVASRDGAAAGGQSMAGFNAGRWSGGRQLFIRPERPDGAVSLEFPVDRTGDYEVAVLLTRAPDYGRVRLAVDGVARGETIDCSGPDVAPLGRIPLGRMALAAGRHQLTLRSAGQGPAATGNRLGIDAVELDRI